MRLKTEKLDDDDDYNNSLKVFTSVKKLTEFSEKESALETNKKIVKKL